MATDLPPITRPNGKTYQPRKITVAIWDNEEAYGQYDDYGVFVLGIHDIERAEALATDRMRREWDTDLIAVKPECRWIRSAYRDGEPAWVEDEERGRAAVQFHADYPPASTERNTRRD